MGFTSYKKYTDADDNGARHSAFIHKTGHTAAAAGYRYIDLSMAAGTPKYNAYAGDATSFTPLVGAGNAGIFTGGNVSPLTKHLSKFAIQSLSANSAPAEYWLADYLGFYALVDMDSTDQQDMDNTLSLTRYTSGEGVRIMLVSTTPQTASVRVDISYTNSNGTAGRVATTYTFANNTGVITCGDAAGGALSTQQWFVPLASGDTGVRSIESITCLGSAGGFCAAVLVKPLAFIQQREVATITEIDYLTERPGVPRIYDGAYLNIMAHFGGNAASAVLRGYADFIWS